MGTVITVWIELTLLYKLVKICPVLQYKKSWYMIISGLFSLEINAHWQPALRDRKINVSYKSTSSQKCISPLVTTLSSRLCCHKAFFVFAAENAQWKSFLRGLWGQIKSVLVQCSAYTPSVIWKTWSLCYTNTEEPLPWRWKLRKTFV